MNPLSDFRRRHAVHYSGTHPMTHRFPKTLLRRLDAMSDRLGWKRSQVIMAILEEGLNLLEAGLELEKRDAPPGDST
jgi:hypothetical protein